MFIISRYVDTRGTRTYLAQFPLREVEYRGEAATFATVKQAEQLMKLVSNKRRKSAYGYNWRIINADGTTKPKNPFAQSK